MLNLLIDRAKVSIKSPAGRKNALKPRAGQKVYNLQLF